MKNFLFYLQVSTKARYQRICLRCLSVCFFLFFLSYLVLCGNEGASVSEGSSHPYQWLPFIWCNWKCMHFLLGRIEKSKDGKPKVENQLSWNILLLLGKENIVLIEVLNYFRERERKGAHILGLYQTILNSYINYSGNIAWKRIDGPAVIE